MDVSEEQLGTIEFDMKNLRDRMSRCKVAEELIEAAGKAAAGFRREFGVEMEIAPETAANLDKIAQWWASRPPVITPEMMAMAALPATPIVATFTS